MQPILFYDGVCNLCHALVQFIVQYDRRKILLFSSLHSEYAKKTLTKDQRNNQTVYVLINNRLYSQSTAIVHILFAMGGWWRMLGIWVWIIPVPIRNIGYGIVSKNRYKWFGHRSTCEIPRDQSRFF